MKSKVQIAIIVLIILTIISLIMNSLLFTNMIYSSSYDTTRLNNLLVSTAFNIVLWINSFLIYIFGLLVIIRAIKSKEEKLLSISFALFSIITTIIFSIAIINFVATFSGIF